MAVKKRTGKKGKTWHYYFRLSGVRFRGVIPEARNKEEAEQAETKIRTEIFEGKYGGRKSKRTVKEFVDVVFVPWAKSNRRLPPWRDQSNPY